MLDQLPKKQDPNLLVGFENSDDGAVYRLNDEMALITTADFITPPVDDARLFGQIAAANALSDVYAMGGKPITCLNLVGFPAQKLDQDILHQIIAGAMDKITEAGAVLAGGHTVEDEEPKFGLSVTGIVHPDRYWANARAQAGDVLILTKPIGSGVLFNANLKKWVSSEAMEKCLQTLITLNKTASEILSSFEVHAATDITGFGLAGHALEMAKASAVTLEINTSVVPMMQEALEMYQRGMSTGVNQANRLMVSVDTQFPENLPSWHQEIFVDPQTSGGLLVSVPEGQSKAIIEKLHHAEVTNAQIIGKVLQLEQKYLVFI